MELLDDQHLDQEERPVPVVVKALTGSYLTFWLTFVLGELEIFEALAMRLLSIGCLGLGAVAGLAVLYELYRKSSPRLRIYGGVMVASQWLLLLYFVLYISGWYVLMRATTFEGWLLLLLVAMSLYLTHYYRTRQAAAAWWGWLEYSIFWYTLVHIDRLLPLFWRDDMLDILLLPWLQITLLWIGTGSLLWWQMRRWTSKERRVAIFLYLGLGLLLSVVEIGGVGHAFAQLLLLLSIILLLLAGRTAQLDELNTERYE